MTPVGGSRHYAGAGLGQEGIWGCPSCGEDNTGPISQGCTHCGAGRPGHRAEPPPAPPPLPRVSERPADDPTYQPVEQGDVADYWASQHPEASVADAYRAGLVDGMRAVREATARAAGSDVEIDDRKINRTIVAALALFRDQVLAQEPEEIETGEWLSVAEANRLIEHLQQQIQEPAHV